MTKAPPRRNARAPSASALSDVAVQALLAGTWEDAAPPTAKEGSDGSEQ